MNQSFVGKFAIVSLVVSALGAGCSGFDAGTAHQVGREAPSGNVGLTLVPVSGVTLNSVQYVVTNSATPPVTFSTGDLPTPGTAKDFSFGLPLPVGTGYNISLSAASAETGDDITCAGSYGPFDIAPNSSKNFTLALTCKDNSSGQIIGVADVKTDACPRLVFDYAVATPSTGTIGKTISVSGRARDLDGRAVTYSWKIASPAVGTFAPLSGPSSTFTCSSPASGARVTVTASNGECIKDLATTLSCVIIDGCGNGVLDPGETCDTAIPGSKCPPDCTATCGDGYVEPPLEDCDPGNTATCTSTCQTRIPTCGDGFINGSEPCDGTTFSSGTPPGSTCKADCSAIIPAPVCACGDGIICGNGTEQCDDAGASPTCSNTCSKVSTAACTACENAGDCFESVDACKGPFGVGEFNSIQQTQCFSVMTCIEKSNCLDGTGSLGRCYCGTLDVGACSAAPFTGAGSPNGACVKEIQAGMPGVTTNAAVLGGLTATSRPAGAAGQRLNCQKTANSSACLDVCGFTAGGPAFP